MDAPHNPAGPFVPEENHSAERRSEFIAELEAAPATLRDSVAGLNEKQLDTRYRNWTIRQIVHHLADSHVNSYVRFKWALTEDRPTIKAYDENRWVALADAQAGDVQAALALFEGLHAQWVRLLRLMSASEFDRSFLHPETGQYVHLGGALCYYAWHCRHHTAQIAWLRQQNGW